MFSWHKIHTPFHYAVIVFLCYYWCCCCCCCCNGYCPLTKLESQQPFRHNGTIMECKKSLLKIRSYMWFNWMTQKCCRNKHISSIIFWSTVEKRLRKVILTQKRCIEVIKPEPTLGVCLCGQICRAANVWFAIYLFGHLNMTIITQKVTQNTRVFVPKSAKTRGT